MKKTITFICLVTLCNIFVFSQSGWQSLNPLGQVGWFNSVYFVNSNIGYAVGRDNTSPGGGEQLGTILKTTNGGINWTRQISGTTEPLYSVYFTDVNTGYVVGKECSGYCIGVILKTTNGGINWTKQLITSTVCLYSVFFVNSNVGYAVGDNKKFLKTTNAGTTWSLHYISNAYSNLNSIYFTDINTGYVVGDNGTIVKTTDGGATWSQQVSGTNQHLHSVYFFAQDSGFIVGDSSKILKTTNSGLNWTAQPVTYIKNLKSVYFTNYTTGFASGTSGCLLKTTDAGITWNQIAFNTYKDFNSVYFTDSNTGYIVGGNTDAFYGDRIILKTTNGGTDWAESVCLTSNNLTSVCFGGIDTGFVVSNNGAIMKTCDGGSNWITKAGISYEIKSIFFNDMNTGYAVGWNKILKTTDGGLNWVNKPNPLGSLAWFKSVYFTDSNTGYVVGVEDANRSIILKTTNGGENWFFNTDYQTGGGFNSVLFTDVNTGYVIWYSGIRKTTDEGNNWVVPTGGNISGLQSIHFPDTNIGFSVGMTGKILKTTNGGNNWIALQSTINNDLSSVYFTNSDVGYIVGQNGTIIKTIDSGINWFIQTSGTTQNLSSIRFTDSNNGLTVGDSGTILKTTNGGANWIAMPNLAIYNLNSIYFFDTNIGYIIGDYGIILKTTDGGNNWISLTSGANYKLSSVDFLSTNFGYAVGDYGTIVKTTNGGINWLAQHDLENNFTSVHFLNNNIGYAVGGGLILKTTNAGVNWTGQTNGISEVLYSVFFIDINIGYVVGSSGIILKTTDGGTTWLTQTSGTTNRLYSVYFIDANLGYIAGGSLYPSGGIILKTINGGQNWTTLSTSTLSYNSVYFTDANTGYVVGDGGIMRKTTNGGANWTLLANGLTHFNLSSVYFADDNTGYAVGEGGTIIKTYTGGEDVNALTDTLKILNIQNISTTSNCHLPYVSKLFVNTIVSGLSYNAGDSLNLHLWFGDGSDTVFTKIIQNIPSYIASYINHTYQFSGFYSVICKVTLPDGRVDSLFLNNFIPITDTCSSITGIVFNDENSNCILEAGEPKIANRKVSLFHNNQFLTLTYTDNNGFYSFDVPNIIDYTVVIDTNYMTGFTLYCPDSASYYINQFPAINKNFALHCGIGVDLNTYMTGSNFRPDFTSNLQLNIQNNSCNPVDGIIIIRMDSLVSFLNSTPTPDFVSGDSVIWNFTNFTNLQDININISVHTDTTALIGSNVCFHVSVYPLVGDFDTSNNIQTYYFSVIGSWDPNFKEVKPANINNPHAVTGTLEYTIHFQNTGNAEAINIFVLDTIDTNLDASTLQILSYSHPMNIHVRTDSIFTILKFNFQNIMLPDSTSNEILSHGYITYTIKVKDNLPAGIVIKNTAHIFFDYNPDIITNTTESIVPDAPLVSTSVNYCINSNAQPLSASGNNLLWYTSLGSVGSVNVPTPLTTEKGSTSYYVSQTNFGIESPKAEIIVTIMQPDTLFQTLSVCNGDSILINNSWHSISGIYRDTLHTNFGCDSVIVSNLQISNLYNSSINETICEGQNFIINNHTYTTQGIYIDTLQTINSCDSIITTNLIVNSLPNAGINVTDTTCTFFSQFNLFSTLIGNPDINGTWNDDDNTGALTDSIFNPSIVNQGIYHFTYTVLGTPPCEDSQSTVSVVVDICQNINEINNSGIYIYPNPNNGKIYIKSENIIQVKVYNIIGEQIFSGNTNTYKTILLKQKGVYLFELSTDKNKIYKKVVVQ